jgi:S-adenosylmethionine hydrolase
MASPVIALITDFGLEDWFVGVTKGVILSINPDATIIDVVHNVPRHDVVAGSFAVLASYSYVPPGAIVVIVVDPGVGTGRAILCMRSAGRYFLAPDNGVLTGIAEREGFEQLATVENDEYFIKPVSSTFHGRDIFAPVAAHLSLGVELDRLGREVKDLKRVEIPSPRIDGEALVLTVRWIDAFGNVITDCPADLVAEVVGRWGRDLALAEGARRLKITDDYESVGRGDFLAIIGSTGHLEVSVREGNAAETLNLRIGSRLGIRKA